jgi:hypothetical protein
VDKAGGQGGQVPASELPEHIRKKN